MVTKGHEAACWRRAVGLAGILAGLGVAAAGAPAERLYGRCRPGCVEVLADGHLEGTGWVASRGGLVVTAGHLVVRSNAVLEVLAGTNRWPAQLVALDRGHDLGLMQALAPEGVLPVLRWAPSAPRVGEEIWQFGTPLFRRGLMQPGRVSSPGTVFEFVPAWVDYAEVRPVSATMPGGTSGGPWLNARGEVVGVQSSVMSLGGNPVGMSFMSTLEAIRHLVRSRTNAATPALGMGVDEVWQQSPEFLAKLPRGTEGLVVSVVQAGGPAAAAGLQVQDVLLEAEGLRLRWIEELGRVVRARRPGQELSLTALRPGEEGVHRCRLKLGWLEAVWPAE